MTRCTFCKRKTSVAIDCQFCVKAFCVKCRLQETHKCANLEECKSAKHLLLAKTLYQQKVVSSKVIKI